MNVTAHTVTRAVRWTHDAALAAVRDIGDEDLSASTGPTAPPISFHLWHAARWADRMAAHLRHELALGDAPEVWLAGAWADRFGFGGSELGYGGTGMGLGDDGWASLPEPDRDVSLAYATAAFHDANELLKSVGAHVERPCTDLYGRAGTVAEVLVHHLAHVSRHLGMIEALLGVSGRSGTASV